MWEYFEHNMTNENGPVAKFKNDKGVTVFYVYEDRDAFIAMPQMDFIKSVVVTFEESSQMTTPEEESQDTHSVLLARMKHACECIEKKYNEQVLKIKTSV